MGVKERVGRQLAPRVTRVAPGLTSSFVREALDRAIHGVGPLRPAAYAADKQLTEQVSSSQRGTSWLRGRTQVEQDARLRDEVATGGSRPSDVDRAIHEVIENHVRYAGAQGFVTNLGGLVTAALTIPANISGLALIQCRMVAGIAHLRGYDLEDPRVRNAVLVSILGEEQVNSLVKRRKLPAPPMALATAPQHDPNLDAIVSVEVASDLIARVAGKRLATTVGRRVPVVGGLVGAGADGYVTWRVGRYADRELLPRAPR